MKKKILYTFLIFIILIIPCIIYCNYYQSMQHHTGQISTYTENDISYCFKTGDKYFQKYNDKTKKFEDFYIKGVNIGLGKPNHFCGNYSIKYDEYYRWLEQISEMNCNTIRVYTIQSPYFYKALYDFNSKTDKPLYFFQGTWYSEDILNKTYDVYNKELYNRLILDMQNIVDAMHGNLSLEYEKGYTYGDYKYDVSKYCIGWILGIESDAEMVNTVNEKYNQKRNYAGQYISAIDTQPFETFWAETGDFILNYEAKKYHFQRPLSFTNWCTTDLLEHPSEEGEEDEVSLNVENLKTMANFKCGLFASYHIYPYYPNFMYTQKDYIDYIDDKGNKNPYKAYLTDLINKHNIPVLVAEYGIPTSRGVTHINPISGYNQGYKTSKEQGEILCHMTDDIYDTGYCGNLIFTWQDECFKRTWNTMDYTNSERRPYWDDVQTNEQNFGILDFIDINKCTIDGKINDWALSDYFDTVNGNDVYIRQDSAYLYIRIDGNDIETNPYIIGFDITPKSGCKTYGKYSFDKPVDFILNLDIKKGSELFVHGWYNRFNYHYSDNKYVNIKQKTPSSPDEELFQEIYLLQEKKLTLPDRDETIPTRIFNTGKLEFGNSDENELSDYYYENNVLEIRIPWGLLNFRDPSNLEIEDDFFTNNEFSGINISSINIGVGNELNKNIITKEYKLSSWEEIEYEEKLKDSYYLLKEKFKNLPN